jgi:3'(2'), 5'-bisphosphate nucleotidase
MDYKADESPITAADAASHRIIMEGLRALTRDIPVLSEEGVLILGVVKAPALKEA